jgi:tight adherence protein B
VTEVLAATGAVLAVVGLYLLLSASGLRLGGNRTQTAVAPRPGRRRSRTIVAARTGGQWTFVLSVVGAGIIAGAAAFALIGAVVPAVAVGAFAASFPFAAARRRALLGRQRAAEAWPGLLEDVRLRTGSLGRSVPQALFEAGRNVPDQWRSAFAAAEREWLLTTDFARTVALLKSLLDDPVADVVGETLLLGYEVGGTDLDGRLADLIDDRTTDLQNRKDAGSRQAGVRFARRFVLLVPAGMALAGLSIGTGRAAYATVGGQIAVTAGVAAVVACWWWSGRLMRLPAEPRVFR